MKRVLATATGLDQPGITAELTDAVARSGAMLIDLEQVVVHNHLTLCFLLELEEKEGREPVMQELLFQAQQLNLEIRFRAVDAAWRPSTSTSYVVTLMADPLLPTALSKLTRKIADKSANIDSIRRLSVERLSSLEIMISLRDRAGEQELRHALFELSLQLGVDVALQRESVARRSKRLVAMDMDSTLIQCEVIDELARLNNAYDKVAEITALAMEGALDYEQSLTKRVALLEGLRFSALKEVADRLPITDGATELVRVLHYMGYRAGVLSGGFDFAAHALKQRLGLDYAYSNRLEVVGDRLTGRVLTPIVTPQRKADLLETIAQQEGIPLEQTIAIGDGANDIYMIERAGLGIAFHAKLKLRQAADTAISAGGLDRIVYLLGINEQQLAEVLQSQS